MSEQEDLAKLALEATKVLVKESYQDIAKPVASRIGDILVGILDAFAYPILWATGPASKAVLNLKAGMKSYAERLAKVKEDQIQSPPDEISVPIMNRLTYTADPDLRGMFLELLSKASDAQHSGEAHPSFIHVIESLSPDEARILRHIKHDGDVPFIKMRLKFNPIEGLDVTSIMTGIEGKLAPLIAKNIPLYFSNLVGLGLLAEPVGVLSNIERWYRPLEAMYAPVAAQLFERGHTDGKKYPIEITRHYFRVTPYGQLFVDACSPK